MKNLLIICFATNHNLKLSEQITLKNLYEDRQNSFKIKKVIINVKILLDYKSKRVQYYG